MGAIASAASGVAAGTQWLDMVAGNVANMNDAATPGSPVYRTQTPVLAPSGGGTAGVAVAGTALGPASGTPAYQPTSPLADAQGMVGYPTDSLVTQLTGANGAQLLVQANAAVLRHAVAAFQSLLGPRSQG